ncbi:helix-turn-helix domain-containing protein [Vibrio tubiashii]|uniref:DNA-binding response regulator PhoP n=1 Tax=Vibrio tubiashii ATCC 19109 TaxID=1051646 RepID=F9T454_9VIBR|nr:MULTISPECIES: helix-turn-helix domain-containing protein [Vibrio]AIW17084.1 transcriptional regulator [Vibrio tubiashii ATCC 19109]EGU56569.1 DNA-binding response regulator PhoP [Vibrio tubiashii ATCC 19109]EIF02772.1 two component transcriptional regulator [Vibrio tubiashii NCIMB 1337 = ATCC 19106]KLN65962.1 transcriptional regulator [Vibrio sp. VPAP30]
MTIQILLIADETLQRTAQVLQLMSQSNIRVSIVGEPRDYANYDQLHPFDCIVYAKSFASLTHWLTATHPQLPYFTAPILWVTQIAHPAPRRKTRCQSLIQWQSLPCSKLTMYARLHKIISDWKHKFEYTHLAYDRMTLHFHSRSLSYRRQHALLTTSEFDLLAYLFVHCNAPVSMSDITIAIREDSLNQQASIRVLICRLRKKLSRTFGEKLIKTSRGRGYCLHLTSSHDNGHLLSQP